VFNTNYPEAAASAFYLGAFRRLEDFHHSDTVNYAEYDIALFMTYPKDLEALKNAKQKNHGLLTGIVDPRSSIVERYMQYTDFMIVDSIEMRDFFFKYGKPIFCYYEYPDITPQRKNHSNKEKTVIGYHGNKVHLIAMYPAITSALEQLGEKYNIEFWAMYNMEQLGIWNIGVPNNIRVRHIQWSMEAYKNELSRVDIGLVPACMPVRKSTLKRSVVSRFFNDNSNDYIIKFKMPSNPGRIIVFSKLHVPVVADFLPSNLQFIKDGETGFLAKSTAGWYMAIERLILSAELRRELSDNMTKTCDKYFNFGGQNIRFTRFLEDLLAGNRISGPQIVENRHLREDLKFNNAFLYEMYNKLKRKAL